MKLVKRYLLLMLVCVCLISNTAFASTNASAQIASYYMNAAAIGNGQIGIDFSITATGYMKEVGAREIYVYEIIPGGLSEKAHYDTSDEGMIETDLWFQSSYVIFDGVPGKSYYITVTIYAKDYNNQSDSRSQSFTVTAT